MWRQVYARLRSLWRWQRQESELDEEIRVHLAMEMEERIAAGMSPEDARAAARRDFGNVPLIRELTRESWGWGPAERLLRDIRTAFRGMRRNPGYTCAVVLTLALGIGLNAAMYGMLSRLFLQAPPHIENPDGIHRVWVGRDDRGDPTRVNDSLRWWAFTALRADTDRFSAVGGYSDPWPTPNGRGQTAEELQVSRVTGGFFGLLGARPVLGRPIAPEDDHPAAPPVAVIGNGYWQRRFGGERPGAMHPGQFASGQRCSGAAGQRFEVGYRSQEVRLLGHQAGVLVADHLGRRDGIHSQPRAVAVGANHFGGSGMARFEQRDGSPLGDAGCQQAGFGGGAGHVVEPGVGHVHPGQLADDRLVFECSLQGSLADLRLVCRVGSGELGTPDQVPGDGRDGTPVRPRAKKVGPRGRCVGAGMFFHQRDQVRLR